MPRPEARADPPGRPVVTPARVAVGALAVLAAGWVYELVRFWGLEPDYADRFLILVAAGWLAYQAWLVSQKPRAFESSAQIMIREEYDLGERIMKTNGAENFALVARMALMMLKREKSKPRLSIASKRKLAGWDHDYLLRVLSTGIAAI